MRSEVILPLFLLIINFYLRNKYFRQQINELQIIKELIIKSIQHLANIQQIITQDNINQKEMSDNQINNIKPEGQKQQIEFQRKPSEQLLSQQSIKKEQQIMGMQKKEQQVQNVLDQLQTEIKELTIQINSLVHEPDNSVVVDMDHLIRKLLIKQKIFHQIKQELTKGNLQQNNQIQEQCTDSAQIKQQKANQIKIKQAQIIKIYQNYMPTLPQITEKKNQFQQQENDDGWTDATQSDAGQLDLDDIIIVDDQMIQQMHMSDEEDGDEQMEQEEGDQQDEDIDLEELQEEFTKGEQSNQNWLYGEHKDKFCVSLSGSLQKNILVSGGGDDKLFIYNLNVEENQKKQQAKQKQTKMIQQKMENVTLQTLTKSSELMQKIMSKPVHVVSHSQTITKIDFSYDKSFIFSLAQKQLLCTSTQTFQTTKVQIDVPTDFCCHKLGGVFAVSLGYNIQIYNIKGFKHYDTYCLDQQISSFQFTQNGKQIVAACDNKLRIITPKTSQIVKVSGNQFHHGQITAMSLSSNTIFTGCIDGFVYASNLTKGNILGSIAGIGTMINNLQFADNYLIVGPSQNIIYWYDSNKLKKIFQNKLKGSSTSIIPLWNKNSFAVGDIKGQIHLIDKRNPLKDDRILKAGNTVHQMWNQKNYLMAACEDGKVRGWDLRKYLN